MSGTLGRVEEFDGSKDDWPQYIERMEYFFEANSIDTAEKKRAFFLSVIGSATYKTLRNLLSPVKPGNKSYDQLVDTLTNLFKPAPSEIVERFRFHSRSRRQGESVATFVAELRSLAEFCNFKDTLEVMLRDRIVCGINDDAMQKRLLSEPRLDYAKAVETAMNMETAAQSVKELKGKPEMYMNTTSTVHKMSPNPSQEQGVACKTEPTCFHCGIQGHTVSKCRIDKSVVCHHCGKRGDMQRTCKGKNRAGQPSNNPRKSRTVRRVEEGQELSTLDFPLYHVKHHMPQLVRL